MKERHLCFLLPKPLPSRLASDASFDRHKYHKPQAVLFISVWVVMHDLCTYEEGAETLPILGAHQL